MSAIHSSAGKRKGTEDDRHLWPEMLRVIGEIQQRGQKETGHTYTCGDGRSRSAANSNEKLLRCGHDGARKIFQDEAERDEKFWTPIQYFDHWLTESPVCRKDDGVPNRVDRIKSLGNAIVPQVAYEIFKAIEIVHEKFAK